MKKYFYKTKFSFLCTPIDIDFCVCVFLVVKLGGELDVEFGRGIGAACAPGVKCFFIHYCCSVDYFWQKKQVYSRKNLHF